MEKKSFSPYQAPLPSHDLARGVFVYIPLAPTLESGGFVIREIHLTNALCGPLRDRR